MWGSDRRGKDCTEIDGVDIVSCTNGQCIVGKSDDRLPIITHADEADSCASGWSKSSNGTVCVKDNDY